MPVDLSGFSAGLCYASDVDESEVIRPGIFFFWGGDSLPFFEIGRERERKREKHTERQRGMERSEAICFDRITTPVVVNIQWGRWAV